MSAQEQVQAKPRPAAQPGAPPPAPAGPEVPAMLAGAAPPPAQPAPSPPAPGAAAGPPPMYAPAMVVPLAPPMKTKLEDKRPWYESQPKPPRMGLTEFQRTAYRAFGSIFSKRTADPKLAESLRRARAGARPEAIQSAALMSALLGGGMGAVMAIVMLGVFVPLIGLELPLPFLLLIALSPALMGAIGYVAVIASPGSRAKARGKEIDNRLPYALNYIAAMASAGVNVDVILKSLAEQKIYGEVAKEAEAIYRDITLYGKDVVTAFKRAIQRSPSQRFSELLQGAITTFASGGDLEKYFSSKAQRYMVENRQEQKAFLDTMGLMAETYVTTAVAGPLFLMVMMAIMGLLQGQGPSSLQLVVYMMLPVVNFGFIYGLMAMTPKV